MPIQSTAKRGEQRGSRPAADAAGSSDEFHPTYWAPKKNTPQRRPREEKETQGDDVPRAVVKAKGGKAPKVTAKAVKEANIECEAFDLQMAQPHQDQCGQPHVGRQRLEAVRAAMHRAAEFVTQEAGAAKSAVAETAENIKAQVDSARDQAAAFGQKVTTGAKDAADAARDEAGARTKTAARKAKEKKEEEEEITQDESEQQDGGVDAQQQPRGKAPKVTAKAAREAKLEQVAFDLQMAQPRKAKFGQPH